ncbi:elongator complex protein 5-like [Dysidea avara]|uniref:elongator complex protein 5-like n=1 Tax=Dysidea avara TaxID=196820 RepID=UPI00332E4DA1
MDDQIKMADSSLPSNHHVVIDSLTVLLRQQGLPAVATLQHTLPGSQLTSRGSVARLVSYLHGDLHSNSDLQRLEQIVSMVMHLDKSPVLGKQLCTITRVKRSGKVLRKREIFHIGENLDGVSSEFVTAKSNTEQQSSDNADPTAGLSFNLTLSNKEKRDRSQVQLPYKYTETQKAEQLEGRVFYQPDDVDDWDDSDPDDDVDI